MKILTYKISEFTEKEISDFSGFVQSKRKTIQKQTAVAHYHTVKYISEYLKKDISRICFEYNSHGKPYVTGAPYFSITHSGDYVFIAFSDREIGIDAEIKKKVRNGLLERICSPDELENTDTDNYSLQTLKVWTLKEAYFKLIGRGITDFKSVTVNYIYNNFEVTVTETEEYILTIIKGR